MGRMGSPMVADAYRPAQARRREIREREGCTATHGKRLRSSGPGGVAARKAVLPGSYPRGAHADRGGDTPTVRRLPALLAALLAITVAAPLAGHAVAAQAVPADRMHAVNVVPPGESGFISTQSFAAVQAGAQSSYGPNFADQLPLYTSWQYKPFQFEQTGTGTHPGGDAGATVYRDASGVPQIYAASEDDLYYAMGYAMAQDRMFQMEVFRHVGHGTLAQVTGAGGLPMDEAGR